MAKCKSCNADIVFVKSPAGKYIPCDEGLIAYKFDDNGKDVLVDDAGEVIRCQIHFEGGADGYARVPHWATCPNADRFRKRKQF